MKAWLDREQAQEYIEHLKQVLLIEQLTQCLPVELHRWVIERSPKTVSDAARFADEFSILYKPLKVEKFGWSNTQGNLFGNRNSAQNAQNLSPANNGNNASMKYFGPPSNSGCQICHLSNHTTENCRRSNFNSHACGGRMFNWRQQQSEGDGAAWPVALLENGTVKEQLPVVSFRLNDSYKPLCSKVRIVSRF